MKILNIGVAYLSKSQIGALINYKKSCEKKIENFYCFDRRKGTFDFGCPLKISIFKNFKVIVETSLIAHSIGNFILNNIKKGTMLIKLISDEI